MAGGARNTAVAVPGSVPSKKGNPAPPAATIERIGSTHATCGAALGHGIRPEVEASNPAMLPNTADLAAEGLIEPPPHVQSVSGVERALAAWCDVPGPEVGELPPGAVRTATKRAGAPPGPRGAA